MTSYVPDKYHTNIINLGGINEKRPESSYGSYALHSDSSREILISSFKLFQPKTTKLSSGQVLQ